MTLIYVYEFEVALDGAGVVDSLGGLNHSCKAE